jgi:hypothetical protein
VPSEILTLSIRALARPYTDPGLRLLSRPSFHGMEKEMNVRNALVWVSLAAFAVSLANAQTAASITITEADCTAAKLGATIPAASIGEPVSAVTLKAPQWHAAAGNNPAYCNVEGSLEPIDQSATARPIHFGVALPAVWTHHATQLGGGGMNGTIPFLTGGVSPQGESFLARGFATYGSDSGHSGGGFGPPSAASGPSSNDWALNDEAIANLGYMQLKKTHDAAMVLIQRLYGAKPRYNYFFGASQGGREALTVVQRYPADYDGVSAEVPIVSFSSLMLGPVLVEIQQKPIANWIPPAKSSAIRAEFLRQCDKLDGLTDGIINNYMGCRAIFDVNQGARGRNPWIARRCPNNIDLNPQDATVNACLTDGQIATLEMLYSRYAFATALANNSKTFGMWIPTTDAQALLDGRRYRGQEGAAANAPNYGSIGVLGVTGFLFKDLSANPLEYVEGGTFNQRRVALSQILDSTNPDLSAFYKHGGKLIVASGTNDTIASPGAQLDYYQSVLDKMGQSTLDKFARFYVIPLANHGLSARSAPIDGDGKTIPSQTIPTNYNRFDLIVDWVENGKTPAKQVVATAADRSVIICSYPTYPKYTSGPAASANSYICSTK